MPTYEYRCDNCEHEFEKFQSIKSSSLKKCPKCKKLKLKRLISGGGGFILKGSGFHATDYRSKNYLEGKKKEEEKNGKKVVNGKEVNTGPLKKDKYGRPIK